MVKCPKCKKQTSLSNWWRHCRRRLDVVLEFQNKWVANNTEKGYDNTTHPKYKQSERLVRKLGFYDDI